MFRQNFDSSHEYITNIHIAFIHKVNNYEYMYDYTCKK